MVSVETVSSYEQFAAMADHWSALLERCHTARVFQTHAWHQSWWDAFGAGRQMWILCLREHGQLCGIVPLCRHTSRFRGFPVNSVCFMVNAATPDADAIMADHRSEYYDALLGELRQDGLRWSLLDLRRLACDSASWGHLMHAADRQGLPVRFRPDLQVPYIPIHGEWDTFLAGRSAGFRKTIQRRLKRMEKHDEPVRVDCLTERQDLLAALPAICRISQHSWKQSIGADLPSNPEMICFLRRLVELTAPRGWVALWMLYIGDSPAAFEFHLQYKGVTYPLRADFDEAYKQLSPGAHLEYEILRTLWQTPWQPVREYNTCADGYAYEMKWTQHVRSYGRAWIFRDSLYGELLHSLGALRRQPRVTQPKASCRVASL